MIMATKKKEVATKRKDVEKKNNDNGAPKKTKLNLCLTDFDQLDFSNASTTKDGRDFNFKISSWNINGLRALVEKQGLDFLNHEKPDVFCLQETKCTEEKIPAEARDFEGYHKFWLSGDAEGYSGVGLLSRAKPINVTYGIGIHEHDEEGRVITAEYETFFVVNAYVPNSQRKLVRLPYRMKWDADFRQYVKRLDAKKPVILCGDLNVAHNEIDIANPKTNKRNAGFTQEERDGLTELLKEGFVDSFGHFHETESAAYTFWTYMMKARERNIGWRLDYFIISERFMDNVCDSVIRKDVLGSDHCPVTLLLRIG